VTFMAGNAAVEAATKIRDQVFGAVAEKLDVEPDRLVAAGGRIAVADDPETGVAWPDAVRATVARFGPLVAAGSYRAPDLAGPYKGSGVGPSPAYSFSACVVEVDCDAETGDVKVDKVWLAHDVGRAINPLLVEGQIEGSVSMALGEALLEEHAFHGALHQGPSLLDYKMQTIHEMPEVESFLVETVDPEGPFGAKEAGQGPLLPVIPAIANAVHDALGVRMDEVPITPDKVIRALRDVAKGGDGRFGPDGVPAFDFGDPIAVEVPEGHGEAGSP